MTYRWIIFDADGTLFDYYRAEVEALARTLEGAGHPFSPDHVAVYQQINGALWRAFESGDIAQEVLVVERFASLCRALGIEADPAELNHSYLEHLSRGTYLIEGAEETLSALSRHVRLAIITNGLMQVQRPRFAASSIGHFFEQVIISDEVGASKPDGRIFDIAFQRLGQPEKEQVLLVGDSLTADIAGGIDYGIDTCWFNPDGKTAPAPYRPTFEISALDHLPPLLGLPG